MYSEEGLDNAVREVQEDGLSTSKATEKHGVIKETLRRWARQPLSRDFQQACGKMHATYL